MIFRERIYRFCVANFIFLLCYCASAPEDISQSKLNKIPIEIQPEVEDNSSRVKKLLNISSNHFYAGKFKEAIDNAAEANSILPSEEGYYLLGLSHYKNKEFQNSRNALETGLEISPGSEQILVAYALTLTALGEEEKSLSVYTKLTEYFPGKDIYLFKRGVSLKSLKLYEESFNTFKKVEDENFNLKSQLYMHMGDVCFGLQKFSLAEEYYKKAKISDPTLVEAQNAKLKAMYAQEMENGIFALNESKPVKAIAHFAQATNLNSKDFLAFLFLGKAFLLNKQFGEAENNFKKSLSLENKNKDAYSSLSAIYLKQGKFQNSIHILHIAIENFPKEVEFYNQLGVSYKSMGNSKLALLTFIRAKEIDKLYLPARKNLAITFLEEGQTLEAFRELKELQTLSPKDKSISEIVSSIEAIDKMEEQTEKLSVWRKKRKLAIGRGYEDKNQWEKAEKFYLDRLTKNVNDEAAKYRLSHIHLKKSKEESHKKDDNSLYSERGDKFYESKKYAEAIEEYSKSFANKKQSLTLTKIFNIYLEIGQKEKCISYLQSIWSNELELNTDVMETIGSLLLKLEQESLAIKMFSQILEKKPESHVSYYQLGLISLSRDRQASLVNFEKSIALNPRYSSAYIARGITYYKLGNRDRAREDFHYALSLESNLEIASYNLGMILYNDNLYKDAESIFLDLTQKYPKFPDPYYHLGYMYYEQKNLPLAEKYILISLDLDRNPTTIYAYIKILEELKNTKSKKEGVNELLQSLKKEIVEKYPNSSYAKNLSDSVFKGKENRVVMQTYPLLDTIISPPIFINQSLIVNYGSSISRLSSDTKSVMWRVETPIAYQVLKAKTRLYGLSKARLDQFDLETGKLIWQIKLNPHSVGNFYVGDSVIFSEIQGGREIIYSYSIEGDLQSSLRLEIGSKWILSTNGTLFAFHNSNDAMSWEIYNSKLSLVKKTQTLIGVEDGNITNIGSLDNSIFILKGDHVYRYETNGNFAKSPKLEDSKSFIYLYKSKIHMRTDNAVYSLNERLDKLQKIQILEKKESDTLVDDNTYLTREGILKIRDKSGKLLWSENLGARADKDKAGIYSIYFKH